MKPSMFDRLRRGLRNRQATRRRRSLVPRFESLEDRRLLVADLRIIDAYPVDGNNNRINEPVLGEQLAIRVDFATTDLPAGSQYRVEFQVDDVPLSVNNLTIGSGTASATGSVSQSGWFTTKPMHQLFVRLDADNRVFEENELNNSILIDLMASTALPPSKFIFPIGAVPFTDIAPRRFVDLDPTAGLLDYGGGQATTAAHDGFNAGPATFHEQDLGIPIFAAADGVVVASSDGRADRQTSGFGGASNFVRIDHGNGWTTEYRHLRRNSVQFTDGQLVKQGDLVGYIGSSGNSTGPQLYFSVRHLGRIVDPFVDQPTFFSSNPIPYVGDTLTIFDSGVTNYLADNHLAERPSDLRIWNNSPNQTSYAWAAFTGLKLDDLLEYVWLKPDGTEHARAMFMMTADAATFVKGLSVAMPATVDFGDWKVEFRVNDVKIGEEAFTVVSQSPAEVRIEDLGGNIVLDDRYTPIDFGQTFEGSTFQPSRTFRIVNHGGSVLALGSLRVPTGFLVSTAPPAALAPGASATFNIVLSSANTGTYVGEIHLATDDADESDYRFAVEGFVSQFNTQRLFLGITDRAIDETGRTLGNVRRSGSTQSGLMVTLTTDDPEEVTIPTTVLIPAGSDRATFVINGRVDGIVDGIDTVQITASATNFSPGINHLDVVDFANDPPTISPLSDVVIPEDTSAGPINFTIGDTETPVGNLIVSATSSNQALLPNANISLTGGGANRSLLMTPLPDQFGTAKISITVTDEGGLPTTSMFNLVVTNVNDPPSDITLSPNSIAENTDTSLAAVAVGALRVVDVDPGDPATYTLVSGLGANDNGSFQITGDILQVRRFVTLNFEAQASYSIRVSVSDGASTFEKPLTVFVTDVNEPPTDILLSNNQVLENVNTNNGPFNVGTLSAVDPDVSGQYTFTLVSGVGDVDNGKFQIANSTLQVRQGQNVDFETQSSYSIRVQVSDGQSSFVKPFTIAVVDLEEVNIVLTASSISEFNGSTTAHVVRSNANGDVTVMLTSSDTTEATVPASILIPDGQLQSAPFTITAVDDQIVDGTQTVFITASAAGFSSSSVALQVTDFEPLSLTLVDASISEKGGGTSGVVTRTDPNGPLVVTLTSSDTTEATITSSVIIPDGQLTSPPILISAVDDALVDGTQVVTFTASATGYVPATANLNVTDFEELSLTIANSSIPEKDGTTTVVVTRTNAIGPLTVQLQSSDLTAATIPATVVIPDGSLQSAPVVITAVDDNLLDGNQSVTITATASGYQPAMGTLTVTDFEPLIVTINTASISENGGVTTATVSRGSISSGNLTVTLSSSAPGTATVQSSVVIPDGQTTSAPFTIQAVDNNVLDPTRTVTITANATGYIAGNGTVQVTDFEPLTVVLGSSSISENGGVTTLFVTRTDASTAVVVSLTSSDTSEATVPPFVLMGVGQSTSALVTVTAVDDSLLDGPQNVVISASATQYVAGTANLTVTDFELLSLNITQTSLGEGQTTTATVTRTDPTGSLTVNLTSSDTTEATVPASIVIPDGQTTSAPFLITTLDDLIMDGNQTVSITASAAGYVDAAGSIVVRDSRALMVSIAASTISENGGTTTATVSRVDTTGALTVQLSSNNPSKVSIPASIVIPAGASTSAPFTINAIDNQLVDGMQSVTITAAATGFDNGLGTLDVTDFEPLTLSFADQFVLEQGGTTIGLVMRTDTRGSLVVNLSSSDTGEATVPATVVIADGQASANFTVTGVDDGQVDGTQMVTIIAMAQGYVSATRSLDVVEVRQLTLNIASNQIGENGDTTTATVSRSDTLGDVTVTLSSSDTSEASVPQTVLIPDGQTTSAPFTITGVDDSLLDGTQTVTITASAFGFSTAMQTINVTDHETLTYSFATLPLLEIQRASVTITRSNTDNNTALSVTLTPSQANQIGVPNPVTIPAGQAAATFVIEALFDTLVEGTQAISLGASAAGYVPAAATVEVSDNPRPYQNPNNRLNVNDDPAGEVSPIDVAIIIADINLNMSRPLGAPTQRPTQFIDVNGDNQVSPVDVAIVINFLNQQGGGEGESRFSAAAINALVSAVIPDFTASPVPNLDGSFDFTAKANRLRLSVAESRTPDSVRRANDTLRDVNSNERSSADHLYFNRPTSPHADLDLDFAATESPRERSPMSLRDRFFASLADDGEGVDQ